MKKLFVKTILLFTLFKIWTLWAQSPSDNWPSFRGNNASGVSNTVTPIMWDIEHLINIKYKVPIPGLAHSCPVIWDDKLFITTAISEDGNADIKTGMFGDIQPIENNSIQEWVVYCLDKNTGKVLWKKTAHRGIPKIKRHPKSTHANSTPATDGSHVVAFFGSEGLYCYDMDGNLIWKNDFGVLNAAFYRAPDAQWGFASSPIIHDGVVIIQSDVLEDSFIGAYDVTNGKELWRTLRSDVPTWCTPSIYHYNNSTRIAVNGYQFIAGYDFKTGDEIWHMAEGGDIPVPTPVIWNDLLFFTSGHGKLMPIYALKSSATGDISLAEGESTNAYIPWSVKRDGAYIPTPIVSGDHLYRLQDRGDFTCFRVDDGKVIYSQRLEGDGWFIASPVASKNAIYCVVETGKVFVIRPGIDFELTATNALGDNCLATPAISNGVIYFRTQNYLISVSE